MHIPFVNDPVKRAQKLIASGITQCSELGRYIESIALDGLWRERKSASGEQFASFPEFATAAQPYGLGICTQDAMDELGAVLHKCGMYGVWKDLLEATTRKQGRPTKNLAASENKVPFFRLPTSNTARARQVMQLAKHHPPVFADLETGNLTLAGAVTAAGLAKPCRRRNLRLNVFDSVGARTLPDGAKRKLLREVFETMGLEAQCHLLANVIGPATAFPELAGRWRAVATRAPNAEDDASK